MTCEILSVGTELLLGQILNTNAQFLSVQLSLMGIDVFFQQTVGDNHERLTGAFLQALERSDVVILTGGLGPTQDDITKEVVASALGLEMERHKPTAQRLTAFFAGRGLEMTPNNLRQAMFPRGAIILENANGTAPGCIVETGGKSAVILPGPPNELQPLFTDKVRPYLEARSDFSIASRVLRIIGMGESSVEDAIKNIINTQTNPTVAPYASLGEVTLRITAKCEKGTDPAPLLNGMEQRIRDILGDKIYAVDAPNMETVVAGMLLKCKRKVAIAESCTGGMLTSALVKFPGISDALHESVVTYSNESKTQRLGVRAETLEKHGAVSRQTALEMANGLLSGGHADVAVAVTGIAGPDGGTEEKPVGLTYIAVCDKNGEERCQEFRFWGSRDRIRSVATLNALNMLRLYLCAKSE